MNVAIKFNHCGLKIYR